MYQATGVILAGGKSARMGADKAFLAVGRDAIIEHVAREIGNICAEVLVAGGSNEAGRRLGLKNVPDLVPGSGPIGGIHAALHAASYEVCLVVACDMPFVSRALAIILMDRVEGYDAAVPRHGVYVEPLFAVYRKTCLPAIEGSISASCRKVASFYPHVRVNYVDETVWRGVADTQRVFLNVNTPQDLDKARKML
ncbi:MAG: molybdenum cofactor guanylyltransferase [Eubacteriales bacterium]